MWHDIVSTLNRAADSALAQAVTAYLQHPLVTAGFLLSLLILSVLLCIETLRGRAIEESVEKPIRIRR